MSLPALRCVAVLTAVGIALVWAAPARSAGLRLRAECRPQRPVVTLGDVADVVAADPDEAETLASIELFPTPPPGGKRFLRPREIQDLLLTRGLNLLEHEISGASQVVVLGAEEGAETAGDARVPVSVAKRAEHRIREAVVRYLEEYVSDDQAWTVDIRFDDEHARLVASAGSEISVRGGMPPWVGSQRFQITVDSADGPVRFDVDARVALPPSVVVAARSLPRGAVICAADVALRRGSQADAESEGFRSVDEVVGKQTARAVPAGNILDRSSVRQPLLVRRGEVITVYARSAGIRVRSTARAREDGSLGDLIAVESLLDRAAYFARVSGIQEVEVYARATQAGRALETGLDAAAGDGLPRSAARSPWAARDEKPGLDPRRQGELWKR